MFSFFSSCSSTNPLASACKYSARAEKKAGPNRRIALPLAKLSHCSPLLHLEMRGVASTIALLYVTPCHRRRRHVQDSPTLPAVSRGAWGKAHQSPNSDSREGSAQNVRRKAV